MSCYLFGLSRESKYLLVPTGAASFGLFLLLIASLARCISFSHPIHSFSSEHILHDADERVVSMLVVLKQSCLFLHLLISVSALDSQHKVPQSSLGFLEPPSFQLLQLVVLVLFLLKLFQVVQVLLSHIQGVLFL